MMFTKNKNVHLDTLFVHSKSYFMCAVYNIFHFWLFHFPIICLIYVYISHYFLSFPERLMTTQKKTVYLF